LNEGRIQSHLFQLPLAPRSREVSTRVRSLLEIDCEGTGQRSGDEYHG
jgi:hypothetical protein